MFIEAKDDGGGGDNGTTGAISRAKLSQIITTNKPTSSFLQARCPSHRPTNGVKALKGRMITIIVRKSANHVNIAFESIFTKV